MSPNRIMVCRQTFQILVLLVILVLVAISRTAVLAVLSDLNRFLIAIRILIIVRYELVFFREIYFNVGCLFLIANTTFSCGSVYKRWLRSASTSLEFSTSSLTGSASADECYLKPHPRTRKLGLAIIIELTAGQEE